jgi:hypothetical protein
MAALESQHCEGNDPAEVVEATKDSGFSASEMTRDANRRMFEVVIADPEHISPQTEIAAKRWADQLDAELTEHARLMAQERRTLRHQKIRHGIENVMAKLFGINRT